MANIYKSIGNTTAAVVSLLAIGTLCWWQRTPGPINAPRPQDEAEIMTAVLERGYGMGQTPGYYKQIETNTIGFFPNATFEYPADIRSNMDRVAAQPCNIHRYDLYRYWLAPSNSYYTSGGMNTEDIASFYLLPTDVLYYSYEYISPIFASDPVWWTNWVTLSTQTLLTQSNTTITTTNIGSLTTNETYTVTGSVVTPGYYAAYNALAGTYTEWTAGKVFYSATPGSFEIADEGAGGGGTLSVYNQNISFYWKVGAGWGGDEQWRAEYVRIPDDCPLVLPNLYLSPLLDLTISFAGYATVTNYQTYGVPSVVTNTYPYNAWTAGRTFAFERDSKPYTWSTNAYNDMARALSAMQWQVSSAMTKKSLNRCGVTISISQSSAGRVFATNVIWDVGPDHDATAGAFFSMSQGTDIINFPFEYRTNQVLTWYSSSMALVITNDTPFTWSDGVSFLSWDWSLVRPLFTNNYGPYPNNAITMLTQTNHALVYNAGGLTNRYPVILIDSGWSIPPRQQRELKIGYTSNEVESIIGTLGDIALREFNVLMAPGHPPIGDINDDPTYFYPTSETNAIAGIPVYGVRDLDPGTLQPLTHIDPDQPMLYYHVQFNALTNYRDHAPAR